MLDIWLFRYTTWNLLHCQRRRENRVIAGTEGQYIGRKSENGTEIYESDILRYCYHTVGSTDFFGEVIYDIRRLDVSDSDAFHVGFILRAKDRGEYWYTDLPTVQDVEVIGNKHENPELLEEVAI